MAEARHRRWLLLAAALVVARQSRPTHALWRFVAGTLALNYGVGHVSGRID